MRRHIAVLLLLAGLAGAPAAAETTLTLEEAMRRARSATPEARAAAASLAEAGERIRLARSGYFPRLDASETVQKGDQPVYAFSSLLSQRRFAEANFAIEELNHPDPLTNTRTAVTLEQPLYAAGQITLAVRAAKLGHEAAGAGLARTQQDLALRAAEAFVRVLRLEAALRAAEAAVAAAEGDLARSRARRSAGVATEADVLAVEVHAADMSQRRIAAAGELEVARMQLAEATGLPLGEPLTLVHPAAAERSAEPEALGAAMTARPERREAETRARLADVALRSARARFLPTIGLQAGWEQNGETFGAQESGWIVGARLELNLFRGFGDRARVAEARHALERAAAERERVERAIEIEVRAAQARLAAARARDETGRASLARAREAQRIQRDRYDGGLATVTDVLRAAEAVLAAESMATDARADVILQTVALDRALGRL